MANQKKSHIRIWILGNFNLIGGLLHWIFEFYLLNNDSIYREFLLIENLLLGFIFTYFALALFWGNAAVKSVILPMNGLFWVLFIGAVLVFQPGVTTLNMFKDWIPVSQSLLLLSFGMIALTLNLFCLRNPRTEEI